MKDNRLILNMARAEINGHVRYYTFDHRRCWCMLQAGVTMVRARIRLHSTRWFARATALELYRSTGWDRGASKTCLT